MKLSSARVYELLARSATPKLHARRATQYDFSQMCTLRKKPSHGRYQEGNKSWHLLYMLPSYGCIFVASCVARNQPESLEHTAIMFASTRLSEYLQNIDCTLRVAQHADCTGQAVVR